MPKKRRRIIKRSKQYWIKVILEIVKDRLQYAPKLSVRDIYYDLATNGLVEGTTQGYKKVDYWLTVMRDEGILDPKIFVDVERESLERDFNFFEEKIWYPQGKIVEFWVEKFDILPQVEDILRAFSIRAIPTRGYSSRTQLIRAIEDRFKKYPKDKQLVILYAGDFDPSGVDIFRYVQEWLSKHYPNIKFKRIYVNYDQIRKYNLPPKPMNARTLKKIRRDPRYKKFVEQYKGEYGVEIQALPIPLRRQILIEEIMKEIVNFEVFHDRLVKTTFDMEAMFLTDEILAQVINFVRQISLRILKQYAKPPTKEEVLENLKKGKRVSLVYDKEIVRRKIVEEVKAIWDDLKNYL